MEFHPLFDTDQLYVIDDDNLQKYGLVPKQIALQYPNKEAIIQNHAIRFHQQKLKGALMVAGVKDKDSELISNQLFQECLKMYETSQKFIIQKTIVDEKSKVITLAFSYFQELMKKLCQENNINFTKKSKFFKNFQVACHILEQRTPLIVLLGGPSGTGKSSIASLLGSKLGISTVLSSDSIRHIMRNFLEKDDYPVLFASTYETHKYYEDPNNPNLSQKKKLILGFAQQSKLVQEKLMAIIDKYNLKKESIVIEGVHLTPDFMIEVVKKYKFVIPVVVQISNDNKHRERFAVRSKYMTIDARQNKYIEYFQNIREIQKYLLKLADLYKIPNVDNTNIDKSMNLIQKTVMRFMRKILINKDYNLDEIGKNNTASLIFDEFNKATKNIMNVTIMKDYINIKEQQLNIKDQQVDKQILWEKFFKQQEQKISEEEEFQLENQVSEKLKLGLTPCLTTNNNNNSNNLQQQENIKSVELKKEEKVEDQKEFSENQINNQKKFQNLENNLQQEQESQKEQQKQQLSPQNLNIDQNQQKRSSGSSMQNKNEELQGHQNIKNNMVDSKEDNFINKPIENEQQQIQQQHDNIAQQTSHTETDKIKKNSYSNLTVTVSKRKSSGQQLCETNQTSASKNNQIIQPQNQESQQQLSTDAHANNKNENLPEQQQQQNNSIQVSNIIQQLTQNQQKNSQKIKQELQIEIKDNKINLEEKPLQINNNNVNDQEVLSSNNSEEKKDNNNTEENDSTHKSAPTAQPQPQPQKGFKISMKQINDLLIKDKKISFNKDINEKSLKKIKFYIKEYNIVSKREKSNEFLKLVLTNERYVVFKYYKDSQNNKNEIITSQSQDQDSSHSQRAYNYLNSILKPNEKIQRGKIKKAKTDFKSSEESRESNVSENEDEQSNVSPGITTQLQNVDTMSQDTLKEHKIDEEDQFLEISEGEEDIHLDPGLMSVEPTDKQTDNISSSSQSDQDEATKLKAQGPIKPILKKTQTHEFLEEQQKHFIKMTSDQNQNYDNQSQQKNNEIE